MMKSLYICLTDFQILNAINLQDKLFKDKKADLFFVTNKEGNDQLAERLKKTNIFQKVFLFNNSRIKGLHYYVKSVTEGKNNDGFFSALLESVKELFYKVNLRFRGMAYGINKKIVTVNKMDFAEYDEVFCLDKRAIVVDCVKQILKATDNKAKINLLDEGTSTYWRSILTDSFPINYIYLHAPLLANYYYEGWQDKIKKIPAIDLQDNKFRNLVNYVFNFNDEGKYAKNSSGMFVVKNKIIFFDQNWDPMPEYFDKINKFMKILLHNPYKKHKKESAFYDRKMEMFRLAADNRNGNTIMVKLHPRSSLAFVEDYSKSECEIAPSVKIPWEVFMDNCIFKNNIWVTVSSTALCTYKIAFKNTMDNIPMIFLYKIVYNGNKDFAEDNEFFENLQKNYPESVFIPRSIEEFKSIYKKLVDNMSRNRILDNDEKTKNS